MNKEQEFIKMDLNEFLSLKKNKSQKVYQLLLKNKVDTIEQFYILCITM